MPALWRFPTTPLKFLDSLLYPKQDPVIFLPWQCVSHTDFISELLHRLETDPGTVSDSGRWVKPATMLFRFGVILTPESSDIEVFVLGSRPEMGRWDPSRAVQMKTSQKLLSLHEPSLWVGDVQLAEPFKDTLWFKFVKRLRGSYIWEGTHHHCNLVHQTGCCF